MFPLSSWDGWTEVSDDASPRQREINEADLRDWLNDPHDPPARPGTRVLCVVCGNTAGISVYGWKCGLCFEAQREERETR